MNVILDYFFVIGPSSDGDGYHGHPKVLAHLPKSVPWNKLNKATLANLASMCLPRGSRAKPESSATDETQFHSFLLTKEDGTTSWGHALEFWQPSGGLSHALVLITTRPLILACSKLLHHVYETMLLRGITLETFSKMLSFMFSLQDTHSLTSIEINRQQIATIPPVHAPSISLYKTFEKIQIAKIIKIITALLLERQLLILSSNLSELSLLTESLQFLLYPFKWHLTYIPLLPPGPEHIESFLDAPVPYIMGIYPDQALKPTFKAEAPGRCIFDLDDGSLSTGIHMPPLPLEQEIRDQVTACFNRLRAEKFESDKKNVFAQFSLHGEDQASSAAVIADKTHEENVALARPFRIAFGLVFCGYESFIVNSAEQKKNTLNFDKVSFLSEQPDYHVDFLAAFLETQSFASFIDEKINARQAMSPERASLAEFDDLIRRIRESHTSIDSLDELPLSEIMKTEIDLAKKPNDLVKTLEFDITDEPLVEFPSLYSPELYQVSQTCSSIHQNPIPLEEEHPSPSLKEYW